MNRLDDWQKYALFTQLEADRELIPTLTAGEVAQRYRRMEVLGEPKIQLPNLAESSVRSAAKKLGIRFAHSRRYNGGANQYTRLADLEQRITQLEQKVEQLEEFRQVARKIPSIATARS